MLPTAPSTSVCAGNPSNVNRPGPHPHLRRRMGDGAATLVGTMLSAMPAALLAATMAVMLAALMSSCSAPPPPGLDMRRLEPPVGRDVSMVFGYLDMERAPTPLERLGMRRISPPGGARFYQMRIHQGIFYLEKFPPGVYELNEFGGQGILRGQRAYRLPRQSPDLRIEIPAPDLYFLGAWRFEPGSGPAGGAFTLGRIEKPRQSEILERLLPFAQGTAWEERLSNRLEKLKREGASNRPADSGPRIDGNFSS